MKFGKYNLTFAPPKTKPGGPDSRRLADLADSEVLAIAQNACTILRDRGWRLRYNSARDHLEAKMETTLSPNNHT